MYSMRNSHLLKHPKTAKRLIWGDIKNRYQRAKRGWGYQDTYSVDYYLLEIIPDMIDELASRRIGYPNDMEFDEWQLTLKKLSDGFRKVKDPDRSVGYEEQKKIYDEFETVTMPLFAKCFFSLWD